MKLQPALVIALGVGGVLAGALLGIGRSAP